MESVLYITLKDLKGKICEFDTEFLKKEVHECYQKYWKNYEGKIC